MQKLIYCVFFVLFFRSGFSQTDSATIQFTVIDKKTKVPIDSAEIKLLNSVTKDSLLLFTDTNGLAKVILPIANYRIECRKKITISEDYVYLTCGKIIQQDILLIHLATSCSFELEKVYPCRLHNIIEVYFDFEKSVIRPDANQELTKKALVFKKYTTMEVEIISHVDCREAKKQGIELARKRSEAVLDFFVAQGIDKKRFILDYYTDRQVNDCDCKKRKHCTEEEHALNRRAEFKIIKFR